MLITNVDKTSTMAEVPIPYEGETVKEYPDGARIQRDTNNDGSRYFVIAPTEYNDDRGNDYPIYPIPSFDELSTAELYVDVHHATGGFDERSVGESGVPPRIAADGSEALVAYLLCQGGVSREWIEKELDIRKGTIYSYLSRLRSRAEEAREEFEE